MPIFPKFEVVEYLKNGPLLSGNSAITLDFN